MKNLLLRLIVFIFFAIHLNSCTDAQKYFPFSEDEMVKNNMFGALLEYAIYDRSKIDFVEGVICDSIRKNQDLVFSKTEAIIYDSSYYFFDCHEREYVINDYIGIIYFDIKNPDSLFYYCEDFKYSIEDLDSVIDEIAKHNKSSIEKTIKYRSINDQYVPNFYFIVEFHSMDCNDGFVKKTIQFQDKINGLMDLYSERKFKNSQIKIRPYIEIRITFTNKS